MGTATLTALESGSDRRAAHIDAPLDGRVPLIVGVTGHIDLDLQQADKLRKAVLHVFEKIRARDPGRPICLLTPLAAGADTLVADVALNLGARLIVALPLARADYERDFNGDARTRFSKLLDDERVINRIELPEVADAAAFDAQTKRELQYALAGAFVARNCDILIALWDGVASNRIGGTAQVVHYRRAGSYAILQELRASLAAVPEPFGVPENLLDLPEVGPLYHIVTPRAQQALPEEAYTHRYLLPYAYAEDPAKAIAYEESIDDIEARVREYHQAERALRRRDPRRVDRSARDLYESNTAAVPAGLLALRQSFAVADALSVQYQRGLHRVLLGLFVMGFVAAAAFAVFADGFAAREAGAQTMIGAYIAVLALADALFLYVKQRRWQDKYQDYRALAEGLRVQFYWRLAGLQHFASDHYVRKQRDELTWIQRSVRACSMGAPAFAAPAFDELHARWTEGQAGYYDTARARAQRKLRWRYAGSGALATSVLLGMWILLQHSIEALALFAIFGVGVLVFVVHAVASLSGRLGNDEGGSDRRARMSGHVAQLAGIAAAAAVTILLISAPDWLAGTPGWQPSAVPEWEIIALGITAVIGALLHGHSEIRAYAEHARHFGGMAAIFRRASDRLRVLLDHGEHNRARELIIELGKEALADHGDWVMLHRDRPIELPEPG